ncbi:MAG: hypothetical protein AB8B52_13585 [Winogradskyella sp.]|uniref:hypothetical protein n=1 Tax=Winogradskyella sp. TaxID=1883156 RepID=UPI00385F0B33
MKKIAFLILMTMTFNLVSGQNLNGKWLLKDIDPGNGKKGYPGFQLLEIENDSVHIFTDFSLKEKASILIMDNGDLLNLKKEKTSTYTVISDNNLKWFVNGKSNDKDAIFECDFYRLEPTMTMLKKEDIEKMTFMLTENGRETEFKFNKELWDKETLERMKRKEGEKKMIEQIDSTLFIVSYFDGKRHSSIPIKEVTTELITMYAIPTGPMEMTAYRNK